MSYMSSRSVLSRDTFLGDDSMDNTECLTISVEEAGRILGYSRNTAYEAVQRGELPTIRLGRKIRVPKAALERMLDGAVPMPKSAA
jgi:excisionase family DNA binding protein